MANRVRKSASRSKKHGRVKPVSRSSAVRAARPAIAGAIGAVTVAAKELKDSAVKAGRKVNVKTAGAVAAAVTAAAVTGLLLRRRK